jgi:putative phage-type endonuclease
MNNDTKFKVFDEKTFNGALILGDFDSGSAEWHELRSRGIGGSEIGTICGLNPWESAFALWAKRTGQIPDPPLDNWSVRFGRAFELPMLDLWSEEHPEYEVFLIGTCQHPDREYLLANPDALARNRDTGEWVVVEVKTARGSWADTPPAYVAQVQHYMDVLSLDRSVIVAVAGWNYEERWVPRDQFQIEAQREAAKRFWDHLQNVQKPEWDGSKATYEATRYMNPDIEDDEVDLGNLGLALVAASSIFANAERELTERKSEVIDAMGKAKYGYVMKDGNKWVVAQRQSRGQGKPWLVVKGEK